MGRGRLTRRLRHLRRTKIRSAWLAVRPFSILLFVVLVLVLGTIGYSQLEAKDYSLLDSFYLAIGLFTLGGSVDPPIPTELQVARILAPIVTGYAVIRGLLALFRDNVQLLYIRVFARRHVVVVGLGRTGRMLASALDEADYRVVAVDADSSNPVLASLRDRGVSVLTGDASDPVILRRARVQRARHLVVASGDDRLDMDVAAAAAGLERSRRFGPLTIFVALDDPRVWRLLSAQVGAEISQPGVRLELFHLPDLSARALIEHHPPFGSATAGPPRVLLVETHGPGESFVLQLARRWLNERGPGGGRLFVDLLGPDADKQVAILRARYPELEEPCELTPRPCLLEASELGEAVAAAARDEGEISSAYVFPAEEGEGLASALGLAQRPELADLPLVVAVDDAEAGIASSLRRARGAARIVGFGVLTSALGPDLLHGGTTEAIARAKHEEYIRGEAAKGLTPEDNPSMRPWEELPEDLQEANRMFADGVGSVLAETGCMLLPAPLAAARPVSFSFPPEQIEELARAEHERWARSRLEMGWRYGPELDPERKLHPSLVDWENLSEAEREKDRQPMRELPLILAQAGYEIVTPAARMNRADPYGRRVAF